jgi:hypothetical protein
MQIPHACCIIFYDLNFASIGENFKNRPMQGIARVDRVLIKNRFIPFTVNSHVAHSLQGVVADDGDRDLPVMTPSSV